MANIATSLTYAFLALSRFPLKALHFSGNLILFMKLTPDFFERLACFFGGPIVNKLGVKWALVIGSMSFPVLGSSYYCNSKFGNQWVRSSAESAALHFDHTLILDSISFLLAQLTALALAAGMSLKLAQS